MYSILSLLGQLWLGPVCFKCTFCLYSASGSRCSCPREVGLPGLRGSPGCGRTWPGVATSGSSSRHTPGISGKMSFLFQDPFLGLFHRDSNLLQLPGWTHTIVGPVLADL